MRTPERVRFVDRSPLRAADLDSAMRMLERRASLHVCAVHRAGGVALGFAVGVGKSRRGLVVGPGFGYDRRGRELVSDKTVFVAAPSTTGLRMLTVRAGRCGLEWAWLEVGAVRDELVLCRCTVTGQKLGTPDVSVRRCARGPGGRLAGGHHDATLAATIEVDTTAAGFRQTPYYFATIAELVSANVGVGLLVAVVDPSPSGFELEVRSAHAANVQGPADGTQLTVHWLGVELPERCEGFEPDLQAIARRGDAADEYAAFASVPPTGDDQPD